MASFKNLLDRVAPTQWHLKLLYADENGSTGYLTIAECRTRLGVKWQHRCFTAALPEKVSRSFVIMRIR